MNRILVLLVLLAALGAGCDEEKQVQELRQVNQQQREQVDQLLASHQTALDELTVQIEREARHRSEEEADDRNHALTFATTVLLGCALAVTLGLLARKRRTDAATPRT
jgi:hypothetical protein